MNFLLLDTAFAAAPIYDYLVRTGNEVFVMGNRAHDLLARKAGKNWIEQDYSQVSDVERLLRDHQIDCVIPGCTDLSIDTCVQLPMNSGFFDPPEVNRLLSNKQLFRRLCANLSLPAPQTRKVTDFPISGDFICKPVDGFSGRGITVFEGTCIEALSEAYQKATEASPSSTALIETFVLGQLYSCSAFVESQRLVGIFYVLEGTSANPFTVDTSCVTSLPIECTEILEASLQKICSELLLKDGLLHCQFILSRSRPFIVEVSRRCPGDLYPLLIEYSTGFDYAGKYASYFIGAKHSTEKRCQKHVLRHTITSTNEAIFAGVVFKSLAAVKAYFPLVALGQEMKTPQAIRTGILFCESETRDELLESYRLFTERVAYDVP